MTSTKWPRKYAYDSTPLVFHVAPKAYAELTDAQKAAIASRMTKVPQDAEASDEDEAVGGGEVDRK